MKRFSILLFGIVWCGILVGLTWCFLCADGHFKGGFPEPYGRWMVYTTLSGFWALGAAVVASGIARLFARGDEKSPKDALLGKFMFIILGATFAALGVFGVCGTVPKTAGVCDSNVHMAFRMFALVMNKVLPMILCVVFVLLGLLVFSIGIRELARPSLKKKSAARSYRTMRLRRTPDLDITKLFCGFVGCIAALGLVIGLKGFQLFVNPLAFKLFLFGAPVAVIGVYAAFVVRLLKRESDKPHYNVTFTGGALKEGAEIGIRYEFAGTSAPNTLKILLVQSDGAIREAGTQEKDVQEAVHETDSPALANAGGFAFTVPKAIPSEHVRWGLVFLFNCEGQEREDYFKLPA